MHDLKMTNVDLCRPGGMWDTKGLLDEDSPRPDGRRSGSPVPGTRSPPATTATAMVVDAGAVIGVRRRKGMAGPGATDGTA
ncbi:hypothetical protein [Streptomyces platensis]|uniref:hypothetical protein n=1 Tax=Streptomyces platensis TaxID=58346 RepID=UPI0036AB181E